MDSLAVNVNLVSALHNNYCQHGVISTTESSLSVGVVGGIAGGVGGVLLLIILVMAVLLILLIVHIRKSGSQDISTATTTGEALDTCTIAMNLLHNGFRNCH